ncbi:MAG TPA: response regulator [Spirochaetota bacterium]|jgi:two-component system chemotaxis response regulator CheY|nr:MAG: hypothetical protein BWX91_00992 [Spirochaetes bacterium ADurb.Bin133]HPY86725.1 response regulator [Spirochaetota bacterium]HQB60027.1 response regulator [Spirochaetota bacterium]
MTIFVVDDSTVLRSIVKTALASFDYDEIIEAKDGEDAWEKIKTMQKKIDLFILDINMPKLNGLQLLERIRAEDKKTPVIILTTESDKDKMIEAKKLGATGWIIKPFDKGKLIQIVDMLIKK